MSTSKDDAENEALPPRIRARLRIVDAEALQRFFAMRERLTDAVQQSFQARAIALLENHEPVPVRLRALYQLVDEYMAYVQPHVACRAGCSHCCHLGVGISAREAAAIGSKVDRLPEQPRYRDYSREDCSDDIAFGYHNPCPFLKEHHCSIYADRPLACRLHVALDRDATLCELHPPHRWKAPQISLTAFFWVVYMRLCGKHRADIRDFFPREDNNK